MASSETGPNLPCTMSRIFANMGEFGLLGILDTFIKDYIAYFIVTLIYLCYINNM
jgi:hypothetical protein